MSGDQVGPSVLLEDSESGRHLSLSPRGGRRGAFNSTRGSTLALSLSAPAGLCWGEYQLQGKYGEYGAGWRCLLGREKLWGMFMAVS